MRHYKVKKFALEARKAQVSGKLLMETLNAFLKLDKKGQHRYALGGGLYKIRIAAKSGRGKSAGARSILAFKTEYASHVAAFIFKK